ncbi:hypothetical protein FB45DRAFT_1112795 [Roridomyces roridus]|uniref:Uncharacterized protein n=1 Tax=Roridomyces roridus TaxID=1738132 RepID=A0AAD7B857_9AGAR|nr:hypothetical protein FB45DRAFT_1112795 [Roridomyces roridus]
MAGIALRQKCKVRTGSNTRGPVLLLIVLNSNPRATRLITAPPPRALLPTSSNSNRLVLFISTRSCSSGATEKKHRHIGVSAWKKAKCPWISVFGSSQSSSEGGCEVMRSALRVPEYSALKRGPSLRATALGLGPRTSVRRRSSAEAVVRLIEAFHPPTMTQTWSTRGRSKARGKRQLSGRGQKQKAERTNSGYLLDHQMSRPAPFDPEAQLFNFPPPTSIEV